MNSFKIFPKRVVPISIIPLVFGIVCHLIEKVIIGAMSYSSLALQAETKESNPLEKYTEAITLRSINFVKQMSFGVYDTYFTFMITMLLINVVVNVISKVKRYLVKVSEPAIMYNLQSSKIHQTYPKQTLSKGKSDVTQIGLISLFKLIILYGIIYSFYYALGKSFAPLFQGQSSPTEQIDTLTQNFKQQESIEIPFQANNLFANLNEEFETVNNMKINGRMLAVKTPEFANILKIIDYPIFSLIFSSDYKTAYASLFDGTLRVIDFSNIMSPVFQESIELGLPFPPEIVLSPDGTTLYAVSTQFLFAIDVSENSPVFLSLTVIHDKDPGADWFPSIVLSQDGKTAFIGGNGFQIVDVSVPANPILIYSQNSNFPTVVAMLSGDNKVFVAGETLEIYDVSERKKPQFLSKVTTSGKGNAIKLSNDGKVAYVVIKTEGVMNLFSSSLEIINLENLDSPTPIKKIRLKNDYEMSYPTKLTLSPDGQALFFTDGYELQAIDLYELRAYIFFQKETYVPISVTMWPDSKTAFVGMLSQSLIIELFKDILPTNQDINLRGNIITRIDSQDEPTSIAISADEKYVYVLNNKIQKFDWKSSLKIYRLSKNFLATQVNLFFFDTDLAPSFVVLSEERKLAFVYFVQEIVILDISNPNSLKQVVKYDTGIPFKSHNIFTLSSDGKMGIIAHFISEDGAKGDYKVELIDFSNLDSIKRIGFFYMPITRFLIPELKVSKDGKTIFFFGHDLHIIDISDKSAISMISSLPLRSSYYNYFALSRDEKLAYLIAQEGGMRFFKIIDISDFTFPRCLSSTILPLLQSSMFLESIKISHNGKTAIIGFQTGLLSFDISDPFAPMSSGSIYLNQWIKSNPINFNSFFMLRDDETIVLSENNGVKFININPEYKLYLTAPKASLGKVYSHNLKALKLNNRKKYSSLDQQYKFIKVSLYSSKIVGSIDKPIITFPSLPSWMHFDREYGILTTEPKLQAHIGSYCIYAAISKVVPKEVFNFIHNQADRQELIASRDPADFAVIFSP